MSHVDQVADLLLEWDDARSNGRELTPEELCSDFPDLVDEVREGIRELQRTDWLFAADETEADFPSLPTKFLDSEKRHSETAPAARISLQEFCERLATSQLVDKERLAAIRAQVTTRTVQELQARLIEGGLLTPYQAKKINDDTHSELTIGDYVILDKIGAGGMGEVFRARHRAMDRIVAIKFLPEWLVDSDLALQRFDREVRAVAKLDHPNIVPAYDAGHSDGKHFLVMQFVDGQDLSSLVNSQGTLSPGAAIAIIRQAVEALRYAHSQGVVHRDVKPSNLLISPKGIVKVLDLGLARLHEKERVEHDDLTGDGATIGTVGYMAPEQALDTRSADERADIYALGCTLHFLLHGSPPFSREEVVQALLTKNELSPPELLSERFEGAADLQQVFAKTVQNDPAKRYQSMEELAEALDCCQVDDVVTMPVVMPTSSMTDTAVMSKQDFDTVPDEEPETKPRKPQKSTPRGVLLGLLGSAALVVALGAIVIKITTPDGKTTEISVPAGSKIAISGGGPNDVSVEGDAPQPVKPPTVAKKRKPIRLTPPRLDENQTKAAEVQKEWANFLGVPVEYTNSLGMKFRLIPPGRFTMGTENERLVELAKETEPFQLAHRQRVLRALEWESPTKLVAVTKPFFLAIHEVTQGQYQEIIGNNPSYNKDGGPNLPVENMTWMDALRFCEKLSKREEFISQYTINSDRDRRVNLYGNGYRLPMEIELEHAIRAGTTTDYWSGDGEEALGKVGWYGGNSGGRTHPVGQKAANPLGLFDVHGNVDEYCENQMVDLSSTDLEHNPQIRQKNPINVIWNIALKGGGAVMSHLQCRSASRTSLNQPATSSKYGFRVMLEVDGVKKKLQAAKK